VLFVRVGDSFCSSYSVGGGGGGVSVIAREKAWSTRVPGHAFHA
jgi:hypothetical protein